MNIILASGSPRRRELLQQIGLAFTVEPADVDETVREGEMAESYALRVARDKAQAVASRRSEGLIIAADTIVVLGARILGKPRDSDDARKMLAALSGRQHTVMTGLVLLNAADGKIREFVTATQVSFRALTEREIAAYVRSGEPLDKAGAYGIQGLGALLVDRIDGCYFNVVGLPLTTLCTLLKEFELFVL